VPTHAARKPGHAGQNVSGLLPPAQRSAPISAGSSVTGKAGLPTSKIDRIISPDRAAAVALRGRGGRTRHWMPTWGDYRLIRRRARWPRPMERHAMAVPTAPRHVRRQSPENSRTASGHTLRGQLTGAGHRPIRRALVPRRPVHARDQGRRPFVPDKLPDELPRDFLVAADGPPLQW